MAMILALIPVIATNTGSDRIRVLQLCRQSCHGDSLLVLDWVMQIVPVS